MRGRRPLKNTQRPAGFNNRRKVQPFREQDGRDDSRMANRLNNRRKDDDGPDSYRVIQFEGSAKHPHRAPGKKRLPEDAYKDVQGIIDEEFQSSFSGFRDRKPPYVGPPKDADYSRLFPGDQKRDGASVHNRRNGYRPGITRHDYREVFYVAIN